MSNRKIEDIEQGFTLIELLVVILIIGILSAIAIPAFLNQRKAANDAVLKADIKSIVLGQEAFVVKNPKLPGTISKFELRKTATRLGEGTMIGVWVVPNIGYCVVGSNKGSDHTGGQAGEEAYFWYDSALGGFVPPVDNATPPVGGACQSPRPPAIETAFFYAGLDGW